MPERALVSDDAPGGSATGLALMKAEQGCTDVLRGAAAGCVDRVRRAETRNAISPSDFRGKARRLDEWSRLEEGYVAVSLHGRPADRALEVLPPTWAATYHSKRWGQHRSLAG